MRSKLLSPLLFFTLSCSALFACSGDDLDPDGAGGETSSGGASGGTPGASGGAQSSGGAVASGGATASGGDDGSGGGSGGTPWAETPGGVAGAPPETWDEHWFEHVQNLKLADWNDWVVVYVDDDVDREQIDWMLPTFTEVWRYTVTHYGQFTDGTRDGRLYLISHQGRYSGGHPGTYLRDRHDYRNVSDVGPGPWPEGSVGIHTHEISHIVELASRGVANSPAFGIWGDSKWAEFFTYDVYMALGWTDKAEAVFNSYTAGSDSFPQPGTYWFRDWFYPLWRDYGGVQVMVNYFQLVADHFPKSGNTYSRGMNFGEFVHFMSAAAGTNLKERATTAFGWPAERETQFNTARSEFPLDY